MTRYSRHARRRMRLYGIAEAEVEATIAAPDAPAEIDDGQWVATRRFADRFGGLPLRVVYTREAEGHVVISAYPRKARRY